MHLQHPFKQLRQLMKGHPELKEAATQRGFARLVGCSVGLIRAVESGAAISAKLEAKVHAITGVSRSWLHHKHLPDGPILTEEGKILMPEMVLARVKQETENNLKEAARDLSRHSGESAGFVAMSNERRLASLMADLVEETLFQSLSRGDGRMMSEIVRIITGGPQPYTPDLQPPPEDVP